MTGGIPATMQAMLLASVRAPLVAGRLPVRHPRAGEVLVHVSACGVCRTDLHIADGDLPEQRSPLVLGHEIVGEVVAVGTEVRGLAPGQRVGVPWLGWTCGSCRYCRAGRENLCEQARFTGYHRDGGYAQFATADARYCFPLPAGPEAATLAPLLCAGLIGYRALTKAGDAGVLGLYGFGAAAHIVAQVALWQGRTVFAFTRSEDTASQGFARSLGCAWAGGSNDQPPEPLDAAILFAPVGALVPAALRATRKGGTVVCAGIHMSPIPAFPYDLLWGERSVVSVANLTRADGEAFLALAPRVPVRTTVETLPLGNANSALRRLRAGEVEGALVLEPAD